MPNKSLVAVLVAGLTVACGDGGTPTAPTPQPRIPQVAGEYTGQITLTAGTTFWNGSGHLTVRQTGNQVSVSGTVVFEGHSVRISNITGSIDANGTFTGPPDQGLGEGVVALLVQSPSAQIQQAIFDVLLGTTSDRTCGARLLESRSLTFSGQTANLVENWRTAHCGSVEISGRLTS